MIILHLLPNLMNLYGDYGNRVVLSRYIKSAGLDATEVLDDSVENLLSEAHCILIGPGTEKSQARALELLQPHKSLLAASIEKGIPILLTGNACEIPVKLGLYPFNITPAPDRITGDAVCSSPEFEKPVIGFYNHMAEMSGITEPLFMNSLGPFKTEGYTDGNMIATYLVGPLLVRNPHVLRYFGQSVLEYANVRSIGQVEPEAEKAYDTALQNLEKRL